MILLHFTALITMVWLFVLAIALRAALSPYRGKRKPC